MTGSATDLLVGGRQLDYLGNAARPARSWHPADLPEVASRFLRIKLYVDESFP
jgi:hypothetical protein